MPFSCNVILQIPKINGPAECDERAEQFIAKLEAQINAIERHASKDGETQLTAENAKLKSEIEELKKQLIFLETRNGVKQIPMVKLNVQVAPTPNPSAAAPKASDKKENKKDSKKETEKPKDNVPRNEKPKAEKKKENKPKAAPGGDDDRPLVDVSRLNIKVGHIVSVKKHPDADSLYVEEVNVGEERNRTIVSGLVKHVPIEQMQDKKALFMCNLKPAKMRGILSEGMIMCASSPEKVEILDIPDGCEVGERVIFDKNPGEPDALLNPKKKIWEMVAPDLKVDDKGLATYKGDPFVIKGRGNVKAPTMKNVQVK